MKTKKSIIVVTVLWIVLVLLTACNLPANFTDKFIDSLKPDTSETPVEVEPTEELMPTELVPASEVTVTPEDIYGGKFADFNVSNYSIPQEFTGGYTLPLTRKQVNGLDALTLSDGQMKALLDNGFVVIPPVDDPDKMYQEFYQLYESIRYHETSAFITTDSVFHIYHLIFDKMLRDLETGEFIPRIKELTMAMMNTTLDQYEALKGTELEIAALRNAAYFTVPALILDLKVSAPNEILQLAQEELALIEGQSGVLTSPIWDTGLQNADDILLEDYSQYIPRGHYTRSDELKAYFKAMMWYGRMTFRLKDPVETQRALLVVQAIRTAEPVSAKSAVGLWQTIYDPTVFIVGKADDLSIYEYGKISDEVFGTSPELITFAEDALMGKFMDAAKKLPPPQINSMWVWIWQDRDDATQGFRFMGQRFTLDAYVFGELMWRKVGTLEKPRDLPKALDFLAAQGSNEAYSILKEMGETEYLNYDKQMTITQERVAGFGLDSWTQNLYWSWLYSLKPIFEVKGKQYPEFMRTQAWLRKDMATALGSWTELKHDTILYAKQVMAEMGGGPEENYPKGYVEPNPEAYARLLALAEMTKTGLQERELLDEITGGNLDNLIDELKYLLTVSQKELSGEALSEEDYFRMRTYGGWLEAMTVAAADPADPTTGSGDIHDQKSALIADVATGIGRVQEEAVGYPTIIYVVTPSEPYHISMGAVYTYYEFEVLQDDRMTDEDWWKMLESGSAPALPEWTSSFIVE